MSLLRFLGFDPDEDQGEIPKGKPVSKADRGSVSLAGLALLEKTVRVGNFEAAVDQCLFAGDAALALVLASAGGPKLFLATKEKHMANAGLHLGLLPLILTRQWETLVETIPLVAWRKGLAVRCSFFWTEVALFFLRGCGQDSTPVAGLKPADAGFNSMPLGCFLNSMPLG
jgi:protein transport protein SEC31